MLLLQILFWTSLAAVVYAYAGYPLALAVCHVFVRKPASEPDEEYLPSVSILMAAYNEVAYIRQKLENCLALDYPQDKLEILIGSDGSDDGTDEIVREFADRGVRLLVFNPRRGKMAAMNRLVRAAQNDVCLFSDVSECFDADALRKLVRHLADPTVGVVAGNHVFDQSRTGLGMGTSVYREFKRFCWKVESRLYSTCRCDGPIYVCRRELFPFPPDGTINDDIAVPFGVLSAGKRIVFEPEAICRGEGHSRTSVFFRQKIRINAGRYQLLRLNRELFVPWPPLRWWIFFSHHVVPLFVPWFMLIALCTNVALSFHENPLYRWLLIPHAGFYLLAAVGFVAERLRIHLRALAIPFYFVGSNLGSLCGFFAFATGRQRATWRKLDAVPDAVQ